MSSHASHQLQSPCVRNDCLCSSAVGQKHETASSSSFITVFKFSLPAVETRLRNLVAIIWKNPHWCVLLLDDHFLLKGCSAAAQYVLHKVIWFMRRVVVLWLRSQPVVSGTHCRKHNAVLLCCANSALRCLPLISQNTPGIMYIHTSGFPKGHETQCVISGALLPCLCSFIAALQPGGVSLCPDGQSGGMTESPPNRSYAARWSCVRGIAGGESKKIEWPLTALLIMARPHCRCHPNPSPLANTLSCPVPFHRE